MMYRAMLAQAADKVHFYCSSGGNAGLACATAAAVLGQPCTIVVPLSTSALIVDKLRLLGASVHQIGMHWAQADAHLRTNLVAHDPVGIYVPPFDHPDIWEGASTIVDELSSAPAPSTIDCIVCSCGGGGLLNGIMEGVERNYRCKEWEWGEEEGRERKKRRPMVLAVETFGADSLNVSVRAGHHVTLPEITSIATSLGAQRVSERTFRWAREAPYLKNEVVTDAEAVMGSCRFADDARLLVEVACGATIAAVLNGHLRRVMIMEGEVRSEEEWRRKNVVVIVCGGSNVTLELLRKYKETYGV